MAGQIQLTADQTNALVNARRILSDIQYDIDKMRQCGMNCEQHQREKAAIDEGLASIIQHFGYQRPMG